MADSSVAITAGSGTAIDTRTEATNGNHRQVVVLGDPSANAGVAPVDSVTGLKVDLGTDNDVVVSDGGGSLTVDASALDIRQIVAATDSITAEQSGAWDVNAAQSGTWNVRMQDGSGNALTSKSTGAERPLTVAIVDGAGAQVTSFGGIGGTSMTDDAAFSPGSTAVTPVAGTYRSVRDAVDDNDGGALAMTSKRALLVSLEDSTGDSAMDDATDSVRVNIVAGGGAGGTSATDGDAYTAAASAGTPAMAAFDDGTPTAATEDKLSILRCSSKRALYTQLRDAAGNERGLNISAGGNISVDTVTTVSSVTQNADVRQGTASNLNAQVVGNVAHDAVAAGNPVRIAGTASSTTPTAVSGNGDVAAIWTTTSGAVNVADGNATLSVDDGGSSVTVDGAVTIGATSQAASAYLPVRVSDGSNFVSASTEYTEGDIDASITGPAIMWEDTSDTLRAVSAAKPLPVNVVAGSAAATEYVEDAALPSNPAGGQLMLRRKDSLSALEVSTDGDAIAANSTSKGELYVKHTDAIPVTDNSTTLSVDDGAGSLTIDGTVTVAGAAAHDAAISGNPTRIAARADTALSGITLVSDGDTTDLYAGVDGVLITRPHCNLEDVVTGNASNTDGTATQCIAASGDAAIKTYLTGCTLTNTSASMTYCEIKSGSTVMWTFPVPATGGVTFAWAVPLKPNAANEAWNFDPGAATTTMYCSMVGFKSRV